MNAKKTINLFFELAIFFIACTSAFLIILKPELITTGTQTALISCFEVIIPSMFPFLVVINLVSGTNVSVILGSIFYPYLYLCKIKNSKASFAIFVGILGGFVSAAVYIQSQLKTRQITKKQAEFLLCCCSLPSITFVVLGVGYALYNSVILGIIIEVSLVAGSLFSGILISLFMKFTNETKTIVVKKIRQNTAEIFVNAIDSAIKTILLVCGYVVVFGLINTVFIEYFCAQNALIASVILEFTSATKASILVGEQGVYYAVAALSVLGLSAYLQIKSILPKSISMFPYLMSRIICSFCSLLIFKALIYYIPIKSEVFSNIVQPLVLPYKFDKTVSCLIFVFILIVLKSIMPKSSLQNRENKILL